MEDLKKEIIKFINMEYEEDANIVDFDSLYPDKSNIELCYGETPDEKFGIIYSIDIINKKERLSIMDLSSNKKTILTEESISLEDFTKSLHNLGYSECLDIPEKELENKLGMELDEDGNIVPSEK